MVPGAIEKSIQAGRISSDWPAGRDMWQCRVDDVLQRLQCKYEMNATKRDEKTKKQDRFGSKNSNFRFTSKFNTNC